MIIYNVTVKLESEVYEDWIKWMKEVHVPEVMQTGFFLENEIYQVMVDDEDNGLTFSIQYRCENRKNLDTYFKNHALNLQQKHKDRYEGKYVAFRTILEKK